MRNEPRGRRQQLTICLLCSGNGGDSSIYRPLKDDKRYRHRHDALVRCVASSLYGGANNNAKAGDTNNCELVFIYDGDLSCIRMSLCPSAAAGSSFSSSSPPPPLEVDIVTSWRDATKEAMQNASRKRRRDGDNHNDYDSGTNVASSVIGSIKGGGARWTVSSSTPSFKDKSTCLKTKCILDSWKTIATSSSGFSPSSHVKSSRKGGAPVSLEDDGIRTRLPSCMPSSKRDIVSVLQRTCPVEYLREHRLNVSENVALRKFNMGKLRMIWEDYCKGVAVVNKKRQNGDVRRDETENTHGAIGGCVNDNDDEEIRQDRMERTFRALMSCANVDGAMVHNGSDRPVKAVATYLHESCDAELPCWGWNGISTNVGDKNGDDDDVEQVFLFLGAVRDMTEIENQALSRACQNLNIPLVGCRLGPIIEFTSKILSVATYHFHQRVLGSKLVELWKSRLDQSRIMNSKVLTIPRTNNRTIHTIALVPMNSQSLTSEPSQRDRILWCMVRICVCSLWRSKLASTSSSSITYEPLNNVLTFLFDDAVRITLEQREFTSTMAERHKAAPSERQILEELCHRRDVAISKIDDIDVTPTCYDIVSSTKSLSSFALDFTNRCDVPNHHLHKEIMNVAYSSRLFQRINMDKDMNNNPAWTLFTILHVRSDLDTQLCDGNGGSMKRIKSIHKRLLRALSNAGVQVRNQTSMLGQSSQDDEACTVTMLQHLDYQGYLYPLLKSTREDEVIDN